MATTDKIQKFFDTDYPLNHEGVSELIASFELKHIPKHSILLSQGVYDQKLRFLNEGLVRDYYAGSRKETNINFYTRPQFITDFSSFINQVPTQKNQESLTDIEVLELGKDRFGELMKKYSCGRNFITLTFQRLLRAKELFEYNRMTKEPEELYRELLIYKAHWLQELPQYHIASYLGITPETLSRIRKRIS